MCVSLELCLWRGCRSALTWNTQVFATHTNHTLAPLEPPSLTQASNEPLANSSERAISVSGENIALAVALIFQKILAVRYL